MKISYITKNDRPRLLLIYAGWSVGPDFFAGICCPGYDIAVAHDFSTLEAADLPNYDEVVLLAWSLGVHAAELTAGHLPLTLTVAVNGTPSPVSDTEGIPVAIFNATAAGLSEQSLAKFRRRMGAPELPRGDRSIESLRDELERFPRIGVDFRWDRAVISSDDRIFPPANQARAWQGRADIVSVAGSHTPDFQAIVSRFVIDKSLMASRFARGHKTYDNAADIQHRIADHLFSLWQKHGPVSGDVLEFGVGTGYFTDLYRHKAKSLTLWDITPADASVLQADAEVEIRRMNATFDAVVSASTIQWFNSPAAFLQRCVRVVRAGGTVVLSTFGPLTFSELTEAGAVPLPYLDQESLRRIFPDGFSILELHSGLIAKEFNDPIQVLDHLRETGVNARSASCPVRELLRRYPRTADGRCSLTYQPIYMILRKQ